jgi:hypothetical protein
MTMKLLAVGAALIMALYPRATVDPDLGSIGGRVMDEKLVGIPSATVSARNVFTGAIEYVRSDAVGEYKFTNLRAGRYSVVARAEGYGCKWVLNVVVFRGKYTELDLVITKSREGAASNGCSESAT